MSKKLAFGVDEALATGWLRTELYGDREKAGTFILTARTQLGALRTYMGVNQRIAEGEAGGFYHSTQTLPDGTVIQVMTNDGHDTIRIHARSEVVEAQPRKDELEYSEEFFAVAGWYTSPDTNDIAPFRWKAEGGFDFPDFPVNYYYGRATGISWDGETVCGEMGGDEDDQAFIWTKSGGTALLGGLASVDDGGSSFALAISGDAGTVVGYGFNGNYTVPFAWTQAGGFVEMQCPAQYNGIKSGRATAVTADGSLVLGWYVKPNGRGNGTRTGVLWNGADGTVATELPLSGTFDTFTGSLTTFERQETYAMPSHTLTSTLEATWIPGTYLGPGRKDVVITSSSGGTTTRTDPNTEFEPPWEWSVTDSYVEHTGAGTATERWVYRDNIEYRVQHEMRPYGVSYDGARVVGSCGAGPQAFLWLDKATDTLPAGLTMLGFLPGDTMSEALGISADGTTVIGRSLGPSGYRWFFWTEPVTDALTGATSGGMVEAGIGSGNAVSQGGVYGAGRSGSLAQSAGSMAITRTLPDADGSVTRADIGAGINDNPSEALAVTFIKYLHHADGSITFEPDLPGLTFY